MVLVMSGFEESYTDVVNFVILYEFRWARSKGLVREASHYISGIRPGIYIFDPDGNVIEFWFGIGEVKGIQSVMSDAVWQYS
jgi:hypothetical protein